MTADLANLVSLDIRSYFELLGRLHCLQTAIKSFEQAFDSKVKSPSYGSIEVVKTTETLKELVENHRPLPSLDLKGYVNTFIGDFSKDDTNIYKDGLIEKYQKGLFTTSEYCMQIQKADAKDLTPSFRFWLANACHHIFYQEKLNPFLSKLSEFASVIPIITELRKGNEEAKTKLRKILGVVDGSHKNIVEKLLKAVIDLLAQNQTIFGSYAEILEPACSALVRRIKEFQSCFEVPNHRPLKMALEVIGSSNEVIRDGVRNQGYDVWYKIVNELQDSNKL